VTTRTDGPRRLPTWLEGPGLIALMVLVVSLLHYNTAMHIHEAHGIYRRLYYFPILIAAFRYGRKGGLITAVVVCLMYIPHAFGLIGFDPAPTLEKVLEMVLYVAVALVAGVLVDRQHAAQARLRRTARDLEASLAAKERMAAELARSERLAAVGQLSAGLAHEIRNPLASIKGSADVLADDFPPGHPKGRLLQILQEEAARLNEVLTRFLDFARPTRGESEPVDLAAELRSLGDLLRHRKGAPGLRIEAAETTGTVVGDRAQLRQMLLNLGLNAVAAAGPDGEVVLAARHEGDQLVIAITDTGPGFTAEAVARLGTPFFSTREGGTGLGLATSLRIARDHGGDLAVDTDYTAGARVLVRLPSAREDT